MKIDSTIYFQYYKMLFIIIRRTVAMLNVLVTKMAALFGKFQNDIDCITNECYHSS
jgi:hypothetical protein